MNLETTALLQDLHRQATMLVLLIVGRDHLEAFSETADEVILETAQNLQIELRRALIPEDGFVDAEVNKIAEEYCRKLGI